jgi:glycerol-3-phosphate cytidylyltransferase
MIKKYNKGYTTGVFDLFHVGHLNVLKQSKELCNHLVVGVTTDELVSYKNTEAFISFEERIQIVEAIKYVDEICAQENMNKMEAWEKIKFDVVFVGSDWKNTEKWNQIEKKFNDIGVDVVYFDYTVTTSSTKIRKKINKFDE